MTTRNSEAGPDRGTGAYYRLHVFCCTNQRPEGHPRGSCAKQGAVNLRNYMKARAKELGLEGVRINSAGCLDRCELGPTLVVYPEGIWYRCATPEDVDAVLLEHLRDGHPVERLMLAPDD
ncbi:MAG: hypothetical protein KDE22_17305 [Rhodobacterales bacterium]|nr:hypothetical protein [Rhodobacterales bacterium]